MNNLHRELAPISDAAWAQIEIETSRTLKRYFGGRRVIDMIGPGGLPFKLIWKKGNSSPLLQAFVGRVEAAKQLVSE
jgi:uncharacterized linocin/CFP29 family protein